MFSIPLVFAITGGYVALLFIVAFWIERNSSWGEKLSNSPFVYALSLGVYCTAWTYYGSVGKAATSGMLFLTMYLGPTLGIVFWWVLLRKLVRIKNAHRITSIADFISSRYNKSEVLAALATIVAVVGSLPYLALQLKAIFTTITLITNSTPQSASSPLTLEQVHILVLVILILFTILLGVRRLDPTERHRGVMVALALESIVKLVAFIAVGIFVTYYINHGLLDIMTSISKEAVAPLVHDINPEGRSYLTWVTYLLLSMSAILFVPRQFHVAVVENSNEKHIRTAMWMFPLYMFLINFFIYPVAMGGLLAGQPLAQADSFVLSLPSISGNQGLVLLVFIGGVSAATGMVFAESMTISTMVTNHLILPLVSRVKSLGFLRRHLLSCRWLVVIGFILLGYLFTVKIAVTFTLVDIGMIAFAAFLQFAPPIVAGLFWPRANKTGAISGLTAGFVLWSYTLLMPTFIKGGWLPSSILTKGPWGIALLNPERLFGVFISNPLIHGVFWSLLCNIGLLVAGSVLSRQDEEEQRIA
ncbi:MAG: sodium:solute symporter family protein, partial [Candidatus Omnitrophica bacterium]|nr:sodium:solute symporter family protein [Candidatus Omnitrophota bacterium]